MAINKLLSIGSYDFVTADKFGKMVGRGCVLSPLFFIVYSLHNSESSKGQIININLPPAANVYFISMWRFPCSMEEILEQQLLIRGRAFATFSTVEKALAGRKKSFRRPCVVHAWST